jgi:rare lipoprotein A
MLNKHKKSRSAILFAVASCVAAFSWAQPYEKTESKSTVSKVPQKVALDRSGKARKGKASYYGKKFHGKKMADGTPMDPNSNIAASKTLPLGTKAKVTNLENGKSEVVEIRDRGPYIDGRIVDVTPKTAEKLDLKKNGVALVEVSPIEVPQADGSIKLGAGATNTTSRSSGQ